MSKECLNDGNHYCKKYNFEKFLTRRTNCPRFSRSHRLFKVLSGHQIGHREAPGAPAPLESKATSLKLPRPQPQPLIEQHYVSRPVRQVPLEVKNTESLFAARLFQMSLSPRPGCTESGRNGSEASAGPSV